MTIEPYGGYRSPPTIDSFSKAPLDSLESDIKRAQQKRAQEKYYRESVSSYRDLPNLLPSQSTPAKTKASEQLQQAEKSNSGFFGKVNSFFDSIYNYFWGSPIEESLGSPISGTPKLSSPSQLGMSQASMERLVKAMDEMNKALERIQEVAKEENVDSTSSEEALALFMFLALLKKQSELKKETVIVNSDAIQLLQKATLKDHEKRKSAQTSLEDSQNSAWWADKINSGAKGVLILTGALQIVEVLGWGTGNPAVALAARMMSVAFMALSGASQLAKTNYDVKQNDLQSKIETLKFRRDERAIQSKDHSNDIKMAHQGINAAATDIAEVIKRAKRVKQAIMQLS